MAVVVGPGEGKSMSRSEKQWKDLSFFGLTALACCLAILWLSGCNNTQSDQQVQQQAAHDTEQVKSGARQAAADAKVAAANAERKVNDIAAGVKQGLHSNSASGNGSDSGAIDINDASQARLTKLPGITATRARRIVNNRPYAAPHDLVSKGVLSEAEYARISGQIVAGNG